MLNYVTIPFSSKSYYQLVFVDEEAEEQLKPEYQSQVEMTNKVLCPQSAWIFHSGLTL